MATNPCASTSRIKSSPSRSPASSATCLGSLTAKLFPHRPNCAFAAIAAPLLVTTLLQCRYNVDTSLATRRYLLLIIANPNHSEFDPVYSIPVLLWDTNPMRSTFNEHAWQGCSNTIS